MFFSTIQLNLNYKDTLRQEKFLKANSLMKTQCITIYSKCIMGCAFVNTPHLHQEKMITPYFP